ncbi:hypothetical protein LWI28_009843 [Acer negundo]|uniref:Uncharacterized protein n=1 Tax=Acer negundo TaxID=4023 RepID=A0AAD5J3Q2_ACENE|nr:hypothetical protein LWI28_009843 [Acer negundo]
MKLYKLARDTGKNMISCDLGEGKTGIILHLHGSLKVLPFRSSDPLKEPFLVLWHDQMNPVQIATKLSELADHYEAVGFYMGFPADSCYMQNPNNDFLIKAESGSLCDDNEDELAEDYLEWVAKGMGF